MGATKRVTFTRPGRSTERGVPQSQQERPFPYLYPLPICTLTYPLPCYRRPIRYPVIEDLSVTLEMGREGGDICTLT